MLNIDDPNSKDYVRKIKIAIWKSLIMRKNGLAVTIFEAFLPVLIYLFLFLYSKSSENLKGNYVNKTSIYKPNHLAMPAKLYLLYSPNFSHVEEFMDSVTQSMSSATLISFSNENEMKRHVKALQENSSLHTIICVVFNDYRKESNKLSYRISTINRRFGFSAAFQGDPPYVSVWAQDYIRSGFVNLQKTIDFVFIEKKASNKIQNMNIKLERMPSPPHKIEKKNKHFSFEPFLYVVPFIALFLRTLPFMMNEKSTGIRQLMFSMGLEKWQYWLEWFLYTLFAYFINITLLTIVLTVNLVKQVPTYLENSNPVIIWFFLFCFYICNVAVVFFANAVFKTYRYAQIVVALWFLLPYVASFFSPEFIPIYISIFLMFIPIFAAVIGGFTLNGMETIGGVHFSNLFKKTSESSNMPSIGVILVMFILDAIIYFSLAWYVSYVFPGAYGIPKKWNFFLQKSFWTAKKVDAKADKIEVREFEKTPEIEAVRGLSVGIMIRNLRKKYQYKYAVDGLNIDVYSKQITVLLGHNGAGKTTTIGLITGMIPATSGTIAIDGYDINTNADIYQKSVGLCLQSNAEIPYLTVLAHLIYFAMLRGSTMAQAKEDSLQFLEMSNLSDKADTVPTNLSGGMRRKLSIGMAMVGNSKVVLLDEPTSGLDPEARRDLWDFLLATRGEKTILITTHYMEEADVLGDRIAIMYNGKLICYGTPLFLKNFYSTGYTLSVLIGHSDSNAIMDLIRNFISSAFVKSVKPGLITYALPTNNTGTLSDLIQVLERNQSRLGINNFGICITSLEDVFVKVGEIADANKGIIKINPNWIKSDSELTEEFSSKFFLCFQALVYKRLHYYRHNKFRMMFYVFSSIIIFWAFSVAFIVAKMILEEDLIVDLKLDMYDNAKSFYTYEPSMDNVAKCYKNVVSAHGGEATNSVDIYKSILDVAKANEAQYHKTLVTGAQFKSTTEIVAMYGHYAIHSPPISLNLITNSLLHSYKSDDTYSIQVAFSPLSNRYATIDIVLPYIVPMMIVLSIYFYICKVILILHEENSVGFKQLQQMSGVPKFLYWMSAFIFDYILYLFIVSTFLLLLLLINYGGCIGYFAYFLVLFGLSCFPYFYSFVLCRCFSSYSRETSNKYTEMIMQLYFVIFGCFTPFIAYMLTIIYPISNKYGKIVLLLLNYYPPHALALGLLKISSKSGAIHMWNTNWEALIALGHPCADLESAKCEEYLSFYGGNAGIGENETILCWIILIHWVLLILYDFGIVSYCIQFLLGIIMCRFSEVFKTPGGEIDGDVLNERNRVIEQLKYLSRNRNDVERNESLDLFLIRNLHKWYLNVYAVRALYFGVKKGECFGLLGVNGAGKTTTFKLLTGEIFQNAGNAYFRGLSLNLNRCNFFKKMGYAPQFDGFLDDLTVHEMLYILGTIRGIPSNKINIHIDKWLTIFDIHTYEHMQCSRLSGGTKRKLNSALSLIGNPILILLDEPTSGIDPVARRNLWDVLTVLQKSGRSIILTSQSMDECEALCDRLAIMVGGQFQCIGNIQYLKSKFGHGCTIKIKIRYENKDAYFNLKQEITSRIDCTLIDEHVSLLVYKVTDESIFLSTAFILMESLKNSYDIIEDYSISSANLEEIFLSFAKK